MQKLRRVSAFSGTVDPSPRVSVVIPCYNYGRYLEGAVRSSLDQPGVRVDVVVVDDASTDGSQRIATELADSDNRVRVVMHARNQGHVETYNEALAMATGEFVVKLDADDLLSPGSLVRSAALMTANPGVVFCYGRPVVFRGEVPQYEPTRVRGWTVWEGNTWIRRVLNRGHNVIHQPEVMIRRRAVVEAGGYRTELRWAEDYNLWLRLAATGQVGRVRGPAQGFYRVHKASLQRTAQNLELSDLKARVDAVELFFSECHDQQEAEELRFLAFRALVRNARELAATARGSGEAAAESIREFNAIATDLESRAHRRVRRGPTALSGPIGQTARDVMWNLRSRRWEACGI